MEIQATSYRGRFIYSMGRVRKAQFTSFCASVLTSLVDVVMLEMMIHLEADVKYGRFFTGKAGCT